MSRKKVADMTADELESYRVYFLDVPAHQFDAWEEQDFRLYLENITA